MVSNSKCYISKPHIETNLGCVTKINTDILYHVYPFIYTPCNLLSAQLFNSDIFNYILIIFCIHNANKINRKFPTDFYF